MHVTSNTQIRSKDLGYLVLFQSKHSCFWCFLISIGIGQHVSTRFISGSSSGLSFFVYGSVSTFCNATYSRCLFLHMVKIHSCCPILTDINPLNPELNPICYLLALLGAHHFLHVSRIRVKSLTLRRLMSYIYGAPIIDVSRSHTTTQHSR